MTGDTSVLGSLHSVDGEGVVRMEDRLDTGIDDLWGALTDPDRLAHWYGVIEGELSQGGEFRVRIALAGERRGRVEACEPPRRLLLTMRDPDPQPGQPEQTVIEAQLIAEGAQTRLVWDPSLRSTGRQLPGNADKLRSHQAHAQPSFPNTGAGERLGRSQPKQDHRRI